MWVYSLSLSTRRICPVCGDRYPFFSVRRKTESVSSVSPIPLCPRHENRPVSKNRRRELFTSTSFRSRTILLRRMPLSTTISIARHPKIRRVAFLSTICVRWQIGFAQAPAAANVRPSDCHEHNLGSLPSGTCLARISYSL